MGISPGYYHSLGKTTGNTLLTDSVQNYYNHKSQSLFVQSSAKQRALGCVIPRPGRLWPQGHSSRNLGPVWLRSSVHTVLS